MLSARRRSRRRSSRRRGSASTRSFPPPRSVGFWRPIPRPVRFRIAATSAPGTIDSWLLFNLTGGAVHATDASNASRTQLFDIHQQDWSDELCALFGVPKSILPRVEDSNAKFGAAKTVHRLIEGVPVHAMMGDSHAALFGHGIRSPGAVKATYGTGSSLMTLTETPIRSRSGLSTTVAWRRSKKVSYALEGNISVSAQAAAWMAELMGLPDVAALTELATKAKGDVNVCFVPALAGLGAPYWKDRARAALTGMSLATSRADVARATLEAIALADPRRLCARWNAISAHPWRGFPSMAERRKTIFSCNTRRTCLVARSNGSRSWSSAHSGRACSRAPLRD